jgi:hypothetical protein
MDNVHDELRAWARTVLDSEDLERALILIDRQEQAGETRIRPDSEIPTSWNRCLMDLHDEPNHLPRIESVWLFISQDKDGEGVCAAPMGALGMVPLIAADPARLASMMGFARQLAGMTGKTIRLIRMTAREEIEVIQPSEPRQG